jgi:SsrA-binding protein
MPREKGQKVVARNRKAFHDYTIGESWEAGMVLQGTEVKSLRAGKASLGDAFAQVDEHGEVWLYNLHIPEYAFGTWRNHEVMRKRKLLLSKREITKLARESADAGKTIVPLQLYFKDGYAKVEIAVGTGKRDWDKRQAIKERDARREAQRAIGSRLKRGRR